MAGKDRRNSPGRSACYLVIGLLIASGGLAPVESAAAGLPWVEIHRAEVAEGDSGSLSLNFSITLSAASDDAVVVSLRTRDISATAGEDYTAFSGQVEIAPQTTAETLSIEVLGDTVDEGYWEYFLVDLSGVTGANQKNYSALGGILDDDDAIRIFNPGGGTVTAPGITCPPDCSETFPRGTTVQIFATPAAGWRYNNWLPLLPLGNPRTVTLDRDIILTARFFTECTYNTGDYYNGGENTIFQLLTADLNNDSRQDPVHVHTSGALVAFEPHLANEINSFDHQSSYETQRHYNNQENPTTFGVVAADLNGEGWSDLIHYRTKFLPAGNLELLPYLSNGIGGFVSQPGFDTGTHYNGFQNPTMFGVVTADVTGDGKDDIVHYRTDTLDGVAGYLVFVPHVSDGLGSFSTQVSYNTGMHYNGGQDTLYGVLVADSNGDGRDDLVHYYTGLYSGEGGYLKLVQHLADGSGSFNRQAVHDTYLHFNGYQNPTMFGVLAADINGDGYDDVVHYRTQTLYGEPGKVVFYSHVSDGSGGFSWAGAYDTGQHYNAYQNPTMFGVIAADINGDGCDDLIHYRTHTYGSIPGSLQFLPYLSNCNGSFTSKSHYNTGDHFNGGETTMFGVLVADVNADGAEDLLHYYTRSRELEIVRHIANGTGGFSCNTVPAGAPPAGDYRQLSVSMIGDGSVIGGTNNQGCCSSHGGVAGCYLGRTICEDGGLSPTCTCTTIDCPGICEEFQIDAANVPLVATPAAGNELAGWIGACTGQGNPCVLNMTADSLTTAVFVTAYRSLSVTREGTGLGVVNSAPSGIGCGTDCGELFIRGTAVELSAAPAGNSMFRGWSGHPDCGDGSVVMTEERSCTARFDLGIFADGFESGDLSSWFRHVP